MSKSMSGHFSGTSGTKSQFIQELKSKNIKFSEKDIQFITKDKTGQTVWLENGNSNAGLKHILDGNGTTKGHAGDFQRAFGISRAEIPAYLEKVISNGKIVESKTKLIGNRTGYERTYYYDGEYHVVTGIGTNGFIVSAYPKRIRK